jgi:sulfur carrier protein
MQIHVNGEPLELADNATISVLVAQMVLDGQRYAIEVNEEIISRSHHDTHGLSDGDQVEVVQAIGGG